MTQINQLKELPEKQQLLKVKSCSLDHISCGLEFSCFNEGGKIPLPDGISLSFLPTLHAILNTVAAISLVTALVAIKKEKRSFIKDGSMQR